MALGTGGWHALFMTFLVGMTPVLELRGAIPLGVAAGLPPNENPTPRGGPAGPPHSSFAAARRG